MYDWISGFQSAFLDFNWISADSVRDFFSDEPLGEADTELEGQCLSRIVEDYNKGVQVPQSLLNCTRYVFYFLICTKNRM